MTWEGIIDVAVNNAGLGGNAPLAEMTDLAGDVGAKHLIGEHADLVAEVEMEDDGILVDIDTPEALASFEALRKAPAA